MKRWIILACFSVTVGVGCAAFDGYLAKVNNSSITKPLASIIGVAASVYLPEATAVLDKICAVSGYRDQDQMITVLQDLWVAADKDNVPVIKDSLSQLVGETKIMDKPATEKQLSEWQRLLGTICCATGKCND